MSVLLPTRFFCSHVGWGFSRHCEMNLTTRVINTSNEGVGRYTQALDLDRTWYLRRVRKGRVNFDNTSFTMSAEFSSYACYRWFHPRKKIVHEQQLRLPQHWNASTSFKARGRQPNSSNSNATLPSGVPSPQILLCLQDSCSSNWWSRCCKEVSVSAIWIKKNVDYHCGWFSLNTLHVLKLVW